MSRLAGTPLWALGGRAIGATGQRIYHIGNSLTQCLDPVAVRAVAQRLGYDHIAGRHICSGCSLPEIVGGVAPELPIHPYGGWPVALGSYEWDAVTIQAHVTSTMLADQTAALALVDYAGDRVGEWWLHAPWPPAADIAAWLDPVVDADSTATIARKAYHGHLLARLQAARPTRTFRLLETGEVIVALNTAGVPALYTDALHLSYGYARFASTLSVVAQAYALATVTGIEHAPYEQADTDPVGAAVYGAIWTAVNTEIIGP